MVRSGHNSYTTTNMTVEHLPIAATLLMRPLDVVPIEAPLIQYLRMLIMWTLRYSVKRTVFLGPSSTWTVQNSLDNEDAGMPLMQVCLTWLIDSTTGHYNSIGTHSTGLLVSLSLASIQQMRALERGFIALIGTSTHCHTYQKYTESLQSNYLGRFRWHKWCPH